MAIANVKVSEATGFAGNQISGADKTRFTVLRITATTDGTSNTLNLATLTKVSGIDAPLVETYDEAVRTTASTWSATTVTFAGHTGSGRYVGYWAVRQ